MRRIWLETPPLYKAVGFGFFLWVILLILAKGLFILMLVLLAVILATVMMPVVLFMRRFAAPRYGWRIPKWLGVLIIYAALAALLVYVVDRVIVALAKEISSLVSSLPGLVQGFMQQFDQFRQSSGLGALFPSASDLLSSIQSGVTVIVGSLGQVQSVVTYVAEFFFGFFFVLVLALFLVEESEPLVGFWVSLFPQDKRPRVREVTSRAASRVGSWLLGQLTVAVVSGIVAGLGVWALGLPYPFLFGVGTTLLDLAPMVGPGIMAIPAGLVGLSHSVLTAVLAVLLFYGLSFIDGHILTPFITGRFVQLRVSLILIVVPLGAALYGIIGALVAIPVTAGLVVIFHDVLLPWLLVQQGRREEARRVEEGGEQDRAA